MNSGNTNNEQQNVVRSQTFEKPFEVSQNIHKPPGIEIAQEPFYLTEADYIHISRGNLLPLQAGVTIFLASIGFLLVLLAKLLTAKINQTAALIEAWEWHVVWLGIAFATIIYVIGKVLPNDKRRLMNEIKEHFRKTPRLRQSPKR